MKESIVKEIWERSCEKHSNTDRDCERFLQEYHTLCSRYNLYIGCIGYDEELGVVVEAPYNSIDDTKTHRANGFKIFITHFCMEVRHYRERKRSKSLVEWLKETYSRPLEFWDITDEEINPFAEEVMDKDFNIFKLIAV